VDRAGIDRECIIIKLGHYPRLESLADPGGICISGKVHDEIRTKLALGYEDLGAQNGQEHCRAGAVFRVMLKGVIATRTTAKVSSGLR
jgi:class 3 adenylate cyclase